MKSIRIENSRHFQTGEYMLTQSHRLFYLLITTQPSWVGKIVQITGSRIRSFGTVHVKGEEKQESSTNYAFPKEYLHTLHKTPTAKKTNHVCLS